MNAFDILGDPIRRRIVELLAQGDSTAGEVTAVVRAEFGVSQPAVSNHLRVLRDAGFTSARANGTRRIYSLNPDPLREASAWVQRQTAFWDQRLDALGTEIARGNTRKVQ